MPAVNNNYAGNNIRCNGAANGNFDGIRNGAEAAAVITEMAVKEDTEAIAMADAVTTVVTEAVEATGGSVRNSHIR